MANAADTKTVMTENLRDMGLDKDSISKATPHKARLTALPLACLHLFRHFRQKLLEIRQYFCIVFGDLTKNLTAQSNDNLCAV